MERPIDMFALVAPAPSLILGLGISRLLSDGIRLFRSRATAPMDWIPIAWATGIFLIQIQFLWGIIELHGVTRQWTLLDFSLLLAVSLCLFVAGALVLPDVALSSGATLEDDFMTDGRWALLALSLAELLCLVIDVRLFRDQLTAITVVTLLATTLIPIAYLLLRSRRARALVSAAYLVVVLWSVLVLSPSQY